VWTGIYPLPDRVEGFKKLFNLPEDVIPFALIPLGYPDQAYRSEDRFKPERIHEEVW
jgi:nitroreductase